MKPSTKTRCLSILLLSLPVAGCNCDGEGQLYQRKPGIDARPNPMTFEATPYTTLTQQLQIENTGDLTLHVSNITINGGDGAFTVAGETAFDLEPTIVR